MSLRLIGLMAVLWWDMKHHSRPSLFSPLWVSVATVSCHLEGPRPHLSFFRGFLCQHNTEQKQYTFFTKSTFLFIHHLFLSCVHFHAVPNMLLLLLFSINSQYYAASQLYDYTNILLHMPYFQTCMHTHTNSIMLFSWTGLFLIHDIQVN